VPKFTPLTQRFADFFDSYGRGVEKQPRTANAVRGSLWSQNFREKVKEGKGAEGEIIN
jgi:hypothetical protein